MPPNPISRRRFLIAGGAAVGGLAAAGIAWLTRSGSVDVATPPTTPTSTAGPSATTTPVVTGTVPAQPTAAPTTTSPTTTTTVPPESMQVICKEEWGAQPASGEFTRHTIGQITVHHTAVALETNTAAPQRVRQHQQYHQGLGWPDLAYHFVIDANGHVYEGRPVEAVGDTATNYDPTGHLLVCCEGDFDRQQVTPAQYDSLTKMLAWGAREFGIEPEAIRAHRDVATTTCPGDDLFAPIVDGTLARDVGAAIANGGVAVEVVCGEPAVAIVAAIETGEI